MTAPSSNSVLELVSTQSTRKILEAVLPKFEKQSGVRISASYIGVSAIKRTGTREIAADVFLGPSEIVDQYAAERQPASMKRCAVALSRSGAAFRPEVRIGGGVLGRHQRRAPRQCVAKVRAERSRCTEARDPRAGRIGGDPRGLRSC
ncbi:hypothetical protein [Variovorax ginsengisoli]|uniref:Uncharacterized protein n=1 Tax=Variovorax ginsengisoli TaxID=363844 RepID=A0ABT8SCB8_9BURK|nr:hypothetical protein [Variovorax ginsengisoli]MDN8617393.1 hypothetical protein [Variovorax ginsengisoli]MDO1536563.1 hypothetical protein [Variovorax ginsengisoli]